MNAALRLLFVSVLVSAAVRAADTSSAPAPSSPWDFHPSLAARLGYDDNVFLQDDAPLLPGVTNAVPAEAGSWVARASVLLETAWKPSAAFQFNASYAPEVVRYEAFSSEDHDNHRFDLGARGRQGPWSYQLKGNLHVVDGSEISPVYGQAGGGPAIGGVGVRSRHEQLNTKLSANVTRAVSGGWMRVVADGVANDYQTRHVSTVAVPGYANYVDRSEWSAGLDLGRDVASGFALVAGVRRGAQNQDDLLGVPHNYNNTFTRFLVGVEGKPRMDLVLRVLAGPDVRDFGGDVAPGYDRSRTTRYVEASSTWTPTAADTVTITGKDYLWLSAGGPCAYQHTVGTLQWKHAFSPAWTAAVAATVEVGDSRDFAPAPPGRDDWIYTGAFTVTRSFGVNTHLDFELVREWSESTITNTAGREYSRWFASVGMRHAF